LLKQAELCLGQLNRHVYGLLRLSGALVRPALLMVALCQSLVLIHLFDFDPANVALLAGNEGT
jgi:hypothetical protein